MVLMLTITDHTVEILEDPTGILSGERFEYLLHINVLEDDELYREEGLLLKVIFVVDENGYKIAQYHFIERGSEKYLDYSLEDDEKEIITEYCKDHLPQV